MTAKWVYKKVQYINCSEIDKYLFDLGLIIL
jgi:hypothetical protein